jgi:hypothetical protein
MHPLDLALSADRVGETVEAVTDDTVDALDAGSGKGLDELVSYSPSWTGSSRDDDETGH